ncbi:MAG: Rieske (2Fe-2S) protein [Candidatus Bathyarchaeota archaeon]|nr:Rieske (2Fe-2S) protein [Candidatus Bathyarchaeota archaeon]
MLEVVGGGNVSDHEDMFVPVLDENELNEGSMKLVNIEGTPVLLVKVLGEIFAIDNRCPHMGCGFSGGSLDGDVIICPCHDWRFNLKTGEYEEMPDMTLVKYEWKIKAGKICVKVEDEEEW